MGSGKLKGAGMIAGMVISWAAYYSISKVIVSATGSAFTAGFLLRSAAFVFLTIQLAISGELKNIFSQGRATPLLLVIGLLGFAQDVLTNLGYAGGSLSTGTALLKTDVLMTNLATVLIYKKRLRGSDWAGTVIMLFGVLMVLGVNTKDMSFNPTDVFFILSALGLTANAFFVRDAQNRHAVKTDIISYYNNFLVMTLSCSCALASGSLKGSVPADSASFWPLVIAGGFAQTLIYFFYYGNLKRCEVWLVKLYLLFIPILSCFIGIAFLGEQLSMMKIAGIITVLAGAAVILLRDRLARS